MPMTLLTLAASAVLVLGASTTGASAATGGHGSGGGAHFGGGFRGGHFHDGLAGPSGFGLGVWPATATPTIGVTMAAGSPNAYGRRGAGGGATCTSATDLIG